MEEEPTVHGLLVFRASCFFLKFVFDLKTAKIRKKEKDGSFLQRFVGMDKRQNGSVQRSSRRLLRIEVITFALGNRLHSTWSVSLLQTRHCTLQILLGLLYLQFCPIFVVFRIQVLRKGGKVHRN